MELEIVIVEDNEADLFLLNEYLYEIKAFSYQISHFFTLADLFGAAFPNKPSIIILDMHLPDGSGEDLFKKVFRHFKGVPIILLTGVLEENLAIKLIQRGAQDYLVKGDITSMALEKAIRYSIERKNYQQKIISSFRALDVTRKRMKMHLDRSRLGFILLNGSLEVIEWSETAENIFGISSKEANGLPLLELSIFTPESKIKAGEIISNPAVEDNDKVIRLRNKQNKRIIFCEWFISKSDIDPNNQVQTSILIKDITEEIEYKLALQITEEEERKRLSREIHDGIGQMLVVVKMRLQNLMESPTEISKEKISELADLLKMTQDEAKNISRSLVPRGINEFGLKNPISFLVNIAEKSTDIKFSFQCESDLKFLKEEVAFAIYRIFQEAINNMIKHSQASKCDILIFTEGTYLIIKLSDNGIGFEEGANASYLGLGLQNMKERAFLIGADFKIDSKPKKGTNIDIKLPFE